jgi:hypothetical protein
MKNNDAIMWQDAQMTKAFQVFLFPPLLYCEDVQN